MKEIKLYNRDGADLRLINIEENQWQFQVDKNHDYVLSYIRCGMNEDNTLNMVDPAGGPYITVGYQLTERLSVDKIIIKDKKITILTVNN